MPWNRVQGISSLFLVPGLYLVAHNLYGSLAPFRCYNRFCIIFLWYRIMVSCFYTIDVSGDIFLILWSDKYYQNQMIWGSPKIFTLFCTNYYSCGIVWPFELLRYGSHKYCIMITYRKFIVLVFFLYSWL